jgi:hypothetical protein
MADLTEQEAVVELANQVALANAALKEATRLADLHGLSFSFDVIGNSTEYRGKGSKQEWESSSDFTDRGEWQNSSSYC